MIQIGDETLNDDGEATFNGTTLDQIIFNGTTVYQKKYPGAVSNTVSFKDNTGEETGNGYYSAGTFTGVLTGVSFTIPAGERPFDRTVNLTLALTIKATSGIDDYSRTAIFEGTVMVDMGTVTIPAGNGIYIVSFPNKAVFFEPNSYWDTGSSDPEPSAQLDIELAVGSITRDDKVTTSLIPWTLYQTFTY
jgi:hypothetical protein